MPTHSSYKDTPTHENGKVGKVFVAFFIICGTNDLRITLYTTNPLQKNDPQGQIYHIVIRSLLDFNNTEVPADLFNS
jgi:hypothetical protein